MNLHALSRCVSLDTPPSFVRILATDFCIFSFAIIFRMNSTNREITLRGIVVARRSSGEGSVRVSLYTDALGLVSALAKSAREERSKLRPHLQVGTLGTFTLVKGRDVWRITGALNAENSYFALAGKPEAQAASARVLSIVRQFVRGEGSDPYLFSALFDFFRALSGMGMEDMPAAECVAILRLLAALGYIGEDPRMAPFLKISYAPALLADAKASRKYLVQFINEGIAVSGL
jgi:hypothetical protein